MNLQEAIATWQSDRQALEALGVSVPDVRAYLPENWKTDLALAMDELPRIGMDAIPTTLTDASSAVPAILTTTIDPNTFRILFAPNKAAEIIGEIKRGSWVDDIIMFPVVEATGEVSSYGDYNENGNAGVNAMWPQRQSYLFQVIKEYGERELERAGLARINWVTEIDNAAALTLNKFQNYTYFFGLLGLQNYGLLNDPNLTASLTPATKAAGGTAWIVGGRINATANEIYADIEAMFYQLTVQTAGLVDQDAQIVLVMSPGTAVALTATNSFNVNVNDLLKKNFPNIRVETAMQYGAITASNPQGLAAGNLVQMIVTELEGQKTMFAAYNEKMRQHPVIRAMSSFRQKVTGGTWGTVVRMPAAIASMVGL